ncbi:hypothetical protein D1007_30504 [Hordeum vulgare]|nr:hypothetical protein D1007_30504 [Hordeum vulgare]
MDSVKNFVNGEAILEGNLPLLQTWYYEKFTVHQLDSSILHESRLRPLIQNWIKEKAKKVLVGRVLTDLQEVASLVREAGAEQVDRMCTLEKKMDESLRHNRANGKLTEDLIKELNLMRHDEPIDTRDDQLVYVERVAGVAKLERDARIEECDKEALAGIPATTQGTGYLKDDMVF